MPPGEYTLPLTVVVALISIGLSIKSALFPFHTWVPDAYGYTTPASSAILSSLVSKGYIFLLIKIMYRVIGLDVIIATGIHNVLFIFGLVGMIMGSISAIRQNDIRRMIAFSSVAQIGYIYMGIGMGTEAGMLAAVFHIFSHAVCKAMLFLAAGGLADASGNSKHFRDLRGSGFRSPIAGVAFTVGALSMVGFPFLGGFISKLNFGTAAMELGDVKTMLVLVALAHFHLAEHGVLPAHGDYPVPSRAARQQLSGGKGTAGLLLQPELRRLCGGKRGAGHSVSAHCERDPHGPGYVRVRKEGLTCLETGIFWFPCCCPF